MSLQNMALKEECQAKTDCPDNRDGIARESAPPDAAGASPAASPSPRRDDDLFSRVPAALLRSRPDGVSDGAMLLLLVLLSWRAIWTGSKQDRRQTRLYWSAPQWAVEIGVSERQIRRWLAELDAAALIVPDARQCGIATTWVVPERGPLWLGSRVDIPLGVIRQLADAPDLAMTWAVLASYRDQHGIAYPGQLCLCGDLGRFSTCDRRGPHPASRGPGAVGS